MSTAHQEARTHPGCAPSLDIGNLVPDEYRIAQVQAKMCCDVDNHSRLGFSTVAVDPIFWDDRVGQVWAMAHGGLRRNAVHCTEPIAIEHGIADDHHVGGLQARLARGNWSIHARIVAATSRRARPCTPLIRVERDLEKQCAGLQCERFHDFAMTSRRRRARLPLRRSLLQRRCSACFAARAAANAEVQQAGLFSQRLVPEVATIKQHLDTVAAPCCEVR